MYGEVHLSRKDHIHDHIPEQGHKSMYTGTHLHLHIIDTPIETYIYIGGWQVVPPAQDVLMFAFSCAT